MADDETVMTPELLELLLHRSERTDVVVLIGDDGLADWMTKLPREVTASLLEVVAAEIRQSKEPRP